MTNLYQKIITAENIKEAYLEVYQSLLEDCKVFSYDVIDAQQIHQTELDLPAFLADIQKRLISAEKPRLARSVAIPKKNGKLRKIYMVPIRERVCCQAVYRVLQEHLKPTYSKYLYSFRSERPSYYALRSLRRFYLANVRGGKASAARPAYFLLKTDFKDYSDHINKNILLGQLAEMGVDAETLRLVRQFVEIPFVRAGDLQSMAYGTMQGLPLISLFNNIYTAEIDRQVGAQVEFYRRVGDDIIALDRDPAKLEWALELIRGECRRLKILLNEEKTELQPLEKQFDYLGLSFSAGQISIPAKKMAKMIADAKTLLPANSTASIEAKLRRLRKVLVINARGKSALWSNYIQSLNLLTDMAQLQELSRRLMTVVWAYLGGGYTGRKLAAGKKILADSKVGLWSFFLHFKRLLWPHQARSHQRRSLWQRLVG